MPKAKFLFQDMGIGELLRKGSLSVPPNQRSYAWRTHHVLDLLQDLESAIFNDDEDYFLGTIVLIGQGQEVPQIADGQQRLATTTLILARIRDLLSELKREISASGIDNDYLRPIDLATEERIPRLRLNVEDNLFFAQCVLPPKSSGAPLESGVRPSNRRLARASTTIEDFLRKMLPNGRDDERISRLLRWISYLKDNASVLVVTVPDDVGAFRMFETLNDRGLRASQADILKNYLLSKAGKRLAEGQRLWDGMSGIIESLGEEEGDEKNEENGGRLVTYLQHFWILEHGQIVAKELAKAIKGEISGETKASRFLAEAYDAATDYVALFSTAHPKWNGYRSSVRHHLTTIHEHLKVEQIRPLLFAVARRFSPEEAEKAYRLFVSWSVRFLVVGGRGGYLNKHYAERAKEVGTGRATKARELREAMRSIVPNDPEFQSAFATARVSKPYLARYYLRALDKVLKHDEEPEYVANEDAAVINLEHVVPETPGSEWGMTAEESAAALKQLGNMVLLRAGRNTAIGNASFDQKKQVYTEESGYQITNQVGQYDKWGIEEIKHRQSEMAKLALRAWPLTFGE